ncbi:hypothetical protein [Falsibacillus pallidus]|uniref:P30 protein n=1 Tax=Falsibacillus pallidus TaxID=493781 RepID=A0A370GNS6_9BACI|nr:hypothetical protein [Falsibacillus pallidus]RDI45388.1 P30 protein [Falsibacillus pallidus]
MKKLWWLGLTLLLAVSVAAGCSSDGEKSTDKKDTKDTESAESSKENVQSDMIDFYMNLTGTINSADTDVQNYDAAAAKEETKKEDLAAMAPSAAASAEAVAGKIGEVTVPDSLKDYKSDLEAALTDLKDSYSMKAEELKKGADANLDAANEKLASADEKMGSILEKAGLTTASITNDVN